MCANYYGGGQHGSSLLLVDAVGLPEFDVGPAVTEYAEFAVNSRSGVFVGTALGDVRLNALVTCDRSGSLASFIAAANSLSRARSASRMLNLNRHVKRRGIIEDRANRSFINGVRGAKRLGDSDRNQH
jgi:hypothetical protein